MLSEPLKLTYFRPAEIQKSLDFTQEMMARVEKRLERVEKRQVKEHSALDEATGHLEVLLHRQPFPYYLHLAAGKLRS